MTGRSSTHEFVKPRVLTFQVEVLGVVMQQIFIREGLSIILDAKRSEVWLSRVYRDIACIVSKTYAERGDSAQLADDVALQVIREILLSIDENIYEDNKDRKLPRKYRRCLPHPVTVVAQTAPEDHVDEQKGKNSR